MARLDPTGVSRILSYIKNWVTTALGGKANSSHSHTKSQITDFPTIPSSTSQLTNDSGYITSSGSCNYANSAGYVQGNNNSANAANALLRNGSGRANSSPEGDTWIFFDECGSPDTPWGFKHNQGANTIGFYASGTETSSINLSTGHFSGTAERSNSSGYADSAGSSSIATRDSGGTWISGRDNAVVKQTRHSTEDGNSWNPAVSVKTKSGNWTIGTVGYDKLQFSYDTDEDYNTGNNRNTVVELNPESGTIITSANIGSQSVNYANSSGNADTLDGYHHDSFPKTYSALFTVNGLGTPGWSTIGTGTGGSCIQVKTTDNTYPSICFHRSGYSHCVLAEYGGQLGTMQQGDGTFNHLITSANIGSQSVNYANSAGNSDTLDGYHEYSFLRNRGATGVSGEGTLWTQIGIKEYYNALPDGLSGVYNYGEVVSLPGANVRFDIYCSHHSSDGNGLYYRSGWGDDKKAWRRFIDDGNTGNISISGYQVYVG